MSKNKYHSGLYLKDALAAMNMDVREFSLRSGITEENLSSLMAGEKDVDDESAGKLGSFLSNSLEMWINLQKAFNV